MKKLKINTFHKLLLIPLLCGLLMVDARQINAAGGGGYFARFIVAASGTVNQPLAITVHTYYYKCSDGYSPANSSTWCEANGHGTTSEMTAANVNDAVKVVVSGSGNTLSNDVVSTDASGNAYITLTSSVAETKTLNAYFPTNVSEGGKIGTATTTINAPAQNSTTTTPKQPAASTTSKPAAPAEVAPPSALAPDIKIDGLLVKSEDKPVIKDNKPIALSGKTVANGVVNIYIFSEPKKYTTSADKDGNWSYEVAGLPPGDHHIEAEVTDPATGKTSPRTQVLAFSVEKDASVTQAANAQKSENTSKQTSSLWLIVGSLSAVILLIGSGLFVFKRPLFYSLLNKLHLKRSL